VTKTRAQWGADWHSLPKTRMTPRPGTAPAIPQSDAPVCACGCGRRILPLAQEQGNPYFSRACLEKHSGIGARDAQGERFRRSTGLRGW
jgi:hypothetical protein